MTSAYVLINSEPGKEHELHSKLQSSNIIKEASVLYGVYDLIVKVEAGDERTLKDSVFRKIRNLDEVRSTL